MAAQLWHEFWILQMKYHELLFNYQSRNQGSTDSKWDTSEEMSYQNKNLLSRGLPGSRWFRHVSMAFTIVYYRRNSLNRESVCYRALQRFRANVRRWCGLVMVVKTSDLHGFKCPKVLVILLPQTWRLSPPPTGPLVNFQTITITPNVSSINYQRSNDDRWGVIR